MQVYISEEEVAYWTAETPMKPPLAPQELFDPLVTYARALFKLVRNQHEGCETCEPDCESAMWLAIGLHTPFAGLLRWVAGLRAC